MTDPREPGREGMSDMRKHEPEVWTIDPSHTTVEFAVKHLMIANVKGQMRVADGEITLDETEVSNSRVSVEIDAASIDTREERRDGHLRSPDFLDVSNHPRIVYRSTAVERKGSGYRVNGDLTIRGVTKPVVLEVEETGRGQDPWGGERLAFEARARFDRRDFGLTWNQVLETGGVAVGHDLRITIAVEAVKQAAAQAA